MFETIKSDYKRATSKRFTLIHFCSICISSKGVAAVMAYRLSNFMYKHKLKILAKYIQNRSIKKYGCDISFKTNIGKGFAIGHPVGIVISGDAIIGNNCTIMSGCTIGAKNLNDPINGNPVIGDSVYIGSGAKIIGKVFISDNTTIGANAVVVKDVPFGQIWGGVPARRLENE